MFNITLKFFSFFNKGPPANWVAHITRDFLTCYPCSYYSSILKLNQPLRKINHGQKTLFYIAPNIWNSSQIPWKQQRDLIPTNTTSEKIFLTEWKISKAIYHIATSAWLYTFSFTIFLLLSLLLSLLLL